MEIFSRPALGWRVWNISESGELSAAVLSYTWKPGLNRAECDLEGVSGNLIETETSPDEPFPHEDHHCGFNAYYDSEFNPYSSENRVSGIIAAAGNLEMHEVGFRAAEAQIVCLVLPSEEAEHRYAYRASELYGIPVFYNEDLALEYAEDYGINLASIIKSEVNYPNDSWVALARYSDSVADQPSVILRDGTKHWYKDDAFHRSGGPAVISYHENGQVKREAWYNNGRLHRFQSGDNPAIVEYDSAGQITKESWFFHDKLHRFDDLPAVIDRETGKKEYYRYGRLHRAKGKPARIFSNGNEWFYEEGELHRIDGPAVIDLLGKEIWYLEGNIHRGGGEPAITCPDGRKEWIEYGKHHRENDLPALDAEGYQYWFIHGERHRDGGKPALIEPGGKKEWWVNGERHRDGGLPAVIYPDGRYEIWESGECKKKGYGLNERGLTDACPSPEIKVSGTGLRKVQGTYRWG